MDDKNLQHSLLERLVNTGAIRVRNDEQASPFWYTSGRPGPFYVNVERIAGQSAVEDILGKINHILASPVAPSVKAQQVWQLITAHMESSPEYRDTVELLVDFYRTQSTNLPVLISGGERRDWFFSIPFAKSLQLPHLFLLKNGGHWLLDHTGQPVDQVLVGQPVLHVADIVNTASSYIRYWLPTLKHLNMQFSETLTAAVRSEAGVQALEQHGVRVITPLDMNPAVFAEAHSVGLISTFALEEIRLYFDSPREWTRALLQTNAQTLIDNYPELTALDKSRMESFLSTDPYQLSEEFPEFFRFSAKVMADKES